MSPITSKPAACDHRPRAIGKKNWLFIGHRNAGQMSAIIYTIVENCRIWEVDSMECLLDVMPRIMEHPSDRIAELLPRARRNGPCWTLTQHPQSLSAAKPVLLLLSLRRHKVRARLLQLMLRSMRPSHRPIQPRGSAHADFTPKLNAAVTSPPITGGPIFPDQKTSSDYGRFSTNFYTTYRSFSLCHSMAQNLRIRKIDRITPNEGLYLLVKLEITRRPFEPRTTLIEFSCL